MHFLGRMVEYMGIIFLQKIYINNKARINHVGNFDVGPILGSHYLPPWP